MIRKATALGLVMGLTLTLAACGASRLNPFNWFRGNSEPAAQVVIDETPQDPRARVETVLDVKVEHVSSGVIVRAKGLSPSQGWWEAELVPQPVTADGVLVLDFRISPPFEPKPVSTQRSREVTVAAHLSNIRLAEVRQIVVQGANDARAVGR